MEYGDALRELREEFNANKSLGEDYRIDAQDARNAGRLKTAEILTELAGICEKAVETIQEIADRNDIILLDSGKENR